jgi:hypothetical protein
MEEALSKSRLFRSGSLVATALTTGLLAFAGSAQAANPGDICQIGNSAGADVVVTGGGGVGFYHLNFGAYFRIEAYGDATHYIGHANGQATGRLLRSDINQGTCH